MGPLASRCCGEMDLPDSGLTCKACGATVSQMESDLAALGGLFAQVVAQVQKLTTPPEVKMERVRIADFFSGAVESEEQVKQAVGSLAGPPAQVVGRGRQDRGGVVVRGAKMTIELKTRKMLWGRSGGMCAICREPLFEDESETDDPSVLRKKDAISSHERKTALVVTTRSPKKSVISTPI